MSLYMFVTIHFHRQLFLTPEPRPQQNNPISHQITNRKKGVSNAILASFSIVLIKNHTNGVRNRIIGRVFAPRNLSNHHEFGL